METCVTTKIDDKSFLRRQARWTLTQRVLQTRFPSLQHLTAHCIWINHDKFTLPNVDCFKCLSDPLKNFLLKEFTKFLPIDFVAMNFNPDDAGICRILSRLINKETANFVCIPEGIPAFDEDAVIKLCRSFLLGQCPVLQKLVFIAEGVPDLEAPFINALVQQQHFKLQIVKIKDFTVSNGDLQAMAKCMPNLGYLDVRFSEEVSVSGFKALSQLEHLETLFYEEFGNGAIRDTTRRHFQLCMHFLPDLHRVGEKFKKSAALNNLGQLTYEWMRAAPTPKTLQLQDVTLNQARHLPDAVRLPKLTTLVLIAPRSNFEFDKRLSTVTELHLYKINTRRCLHILGLMGRQLRKLVLDVLNTLPMDQIFVLCPNLQWFSFQCFPRRVSLASGHIPSESLQQLQVLDLSAHTYAGRWDHHGANQFAADQGVLLGLLQAPKLRKIKLAFFALDKTELDEIVLQVQQKQILQQIEFCMMESLRNTETRVSMNETSQLNLLMSTMVVNCPKLLAVFDRCCAKQIKSMDEWQGEL